MIADSGVVEAFKITRTEFGYLNEKQQSLIYDQLVQIKEPDRPEKEDVIKRIREEFIRWDDDKKARVKKVILEHKIRKYGVMAIKDEVLCDEKQKKNEKDCQISAEPRFA